MEKHEGNAVTSCGRARESHPCDGASGLGLRLNGWQDGVIVIDGELSDELPRYPQFNQAIQGVLARAKAKGLLSIRRMVDDPAQIRVIKAILTRLKIPKDQSYFKVTGAWACSNWVRYSGVAHFDHYIWSTWVVILCIILPVLF